MALEHALLAALDERSGSGYELARRFDKSIGFFHSATHQQIYRVLRRMEERGWITGRTVPQDGRPDKKVYRVSAAGRTELDRWISQPSDPEQLRSDLA
ncbi:PadR family transcriptional regulator, partial [Rhodococcus sp. CSLK01-03]